MKYLKLVNRMLGDCPDFRKYKVIGNVKTPCGIDWAKLECNPEVVRRLGIVGKIKSGDMISVIPIKNESNQLILAAIQDTNNNQFEEDTAEIIDSYAADVLKSEIEANKTTSN